MEKKTKVLFLCTGNSCRSQMAEGWANSLGLQDVEFYSAGIEAHGLNPNAIMVMQESGVDISGHRSELLSEFVDIEFDFVYAVCDHANKSCPSFDGHTQVICYQFDDPPKMAAATEDQAIALDCYRQVRDQIKDWIEELPQQLAVN
ncbi:arsenate reductase ArsC [Enterovibrio baiacu]|uniref:arsenate reductase ArsC n=1 Tax=Enterovibrio baiacu TaxID=2491023 RepID=UPI001010BDCF|nr:arsenate reductase ArsC [Enterovibrio baiacu]MBE1276625.1 arsenate reductase ArsC [Enterovibrio baiacu]